jgi:hypothetical protein
MKDEPEGVVTWAVPFENGTWVVATGKRLGL